MSGDSLKLGDFGLAYLVYGTTQKKPIDSSGTLAYMSPEKIESIVLGSVRSYSFDEMAKSDVW